MSKIGRFFILGDSYSTFEGYIPEGYESFYVPGGRENSDVTRVEETWWHRLILDDGAELVRNCSYSGTTVCNTGYGGYCPDTSFIGRFDRLVDEGFFEENKVDTIFIFGGTNDAWVPSPVGEVKYGDFTEDDLREALPAFCYLIERMKKAVHGARVVNILNDVVVKHELVAGYREACIHYCVDFVGVGDFDRMDGHPTVLGMKQIADAVMGIF